jgi:hypothetical protein
VFPPLAEKAVEPFRSETLAAVKEVQGVVDEGQRSGALPPGRTAEALRSAIKNAPKGEEAGKVVGQIRSVLLPADNYGGRMSFRYVAPFSIAIILVFGVLYLRDRAAGGYKAEKLTAAGSH